MNVSMATSGGHPGRANEDFVGAVPGAVVLLDGAGIPGTEFLCRHGVAWFTHRLGGVLLGLLSLGAEQDLATILATAIDEVAADHRDTCNLTHPSSPQATVLIVRLGDERADYLMLADTYLLLDRVCADPQIVTDDREVTARRLCTAPLDGVARGTAEYDSIRAACIQALQARRNQPGGYWIAKDDPRAATEAVTGSCPLRELDSIALLSNGASRIVSPYGRTDWLGVLGLLRSGGPAEIIRRVRQAEADDPAEPVAAIPDDATVVHCTQLPGRPSWRPPQPQKD